MSYKLTYTKNEKKRVVSSMVEHLVYTEEVVGSSPTSPMMNGGKYGIHGVRTKSMVRF